MMQKNSSIKSENIGLADNSVLSTDHDFNFLRKVLARNNIQCSVPDSGIDGRFLRFTRKSKLSMDIANTVDRVISEYRFVTVGELSMINRMMYLIKVERARKKLLVNS